VQEKNATQEEQKLQTKVLNTIHT